LELFLKADTQRPAKGRRSGKALFVQIQVQGYAGGYSRVTDFIRAWRAQSGKAQSKAFVPLVFELGEAFQFDWSEEGMLVGGVYHPTSAQRLQAMYFTRCAVESVC
jgi:hypothetical protein